MQRTTGRKTAKCLLGTLIYIFALLILLFIVVFVIVPFVFKYSTEIQRALIFATWITPASDFENPQYYGLKGVRNFYITVDENENITLGTWQILPEELVSEFMKNDDYDYDKILTNKNYNILLYFHGNGAVRTMPLELYKILRKQFHIIAPDYRGYGDSSKALLNEFGIVNDTVNLYKWLRERTSARIFFWGHSLGTGVSTHAIANLKSRGDIPSGLILETPFSTVLDVMELHPVLKAYSWLPWYKLTMLDPIISNGFGFESTKHILDVDCPIMILHAKDDTIIPYHLATKLYETALEARKPNQGNITYHLWDGLGYDHMELYLAPELPRYVKKFVNDCLEFENSLNGTL